MTTDEKYMARAIQLARLGQGFTTPNPMVGAVIVAQGHIIGEGFHRIYGGPHAEVNAINAVKPENRRLLGESTVYVTLEPCSHYGKTPPCANLLTEKGVKRVVIGMKDPFPKVNGGGIQILTEAGIQVCTGILEKECKNLNLRFITAHTLKRPYIQLKWAQTADGFIGKQETRLTISTPLSRVWMHKERADADAILIGTNTMEKEHPALNCRFFPGSEKIRITFDISNRLTGNTDGWIVIKENIGLKKLMNDLYVQKGVTSVMVEGGKKILNAFIKERLFDEIRTEQSPMYAGDGITAPEMPGNISEIERIRCGENIIKRFIADRLSNHMDEDVKKS